MLQYTVEKKDDGWYYYIVGGYKESFKCSYGPFVGEESAVISAKNMIEVLKENFSW